MSSEVGRRPPGLLYIATVAATVRQFLRPHARHFRASGWRVGAAASGVEDDPEVQAAFDDVWEIPLSRSLREVGSLIRGERAISRVLREATPDIVHVHSPIASFITRLAIRWMAADRRPAVVYTAHGFHFFRGGSRIPNAAFLFAEKLAGRWTDRLIVINDEDEAAALRHRIVRRGSLIRMPGIGVDTDHYARAAISPIALSGVRTTLGIPPGCPYFVIVGEFTRNKRQADAIAALARMHDRDSRLVLLGDGSTRQLLEDLARGLRIEHRVVFAGIVRDVRPVVAGSIALLLCSGREGLARSVMEALALEVPVVASDARGDRELVGESGRILTVGDVDGFATAMDWLLDHPDERRVMGERGRSRMVEDYELRVVIALHEALYASLLAARPARPVTSSPSRPASLR